jgi:hypothetical protein
VALALAGCSALPAPAQDLSPSLDQRISIHLGQRSFTEDDYEPVEEQLVIGLEYASQPRDGIIGFEVGMMGSSDEDEIGASDVEAETGELYGGVRKSFGRGAVRPVIGFGVALIHASVDIAGFADEDDASVAGYFHSGVAGRLGSTFSLGIDLRALFGSELDLGGFDVDADYVQLALVLGFDL